MKDRIRGMFIKILNTQGEPKDIALACAIGVFLAFFPIFGTHTALAFVLAWLFRISPAITLGATFVNNPWTIAPMYGGALYLGVLITGTDISEAHIDWHSVNWSVFVKLVKVIGIPFVTGCLLLGAVAGIIAYFIAFRAVVVYRSRKEKAAQGAQ